MTTLVDDRAITASDRPRGPRRSRRFRDGRTGLLFLLPFVAAFSLCFLAPIVVSIKESLFQARPSGGGLYGGGGVVQTFVGLGNFGTILNNQEFWQGVGRVALFGVFQIPFMIGLALALALILDSTLINRVSGFRLAYFLPYAVPGLIAALVWTYVYSPQFSPVNQALGAVGLPAIPFFDPNVIIASMANMTTWTFTGYNMLIFLAALQAIPSDLYNAARIDGASEWRIVFSIKIPLVSRAVLLTVLLSIIGTVQLFNEPTVLAAVNPWMGRAYTPMMMAYNSVSGNVSPSGPGPASAISLLMALGAGLLAALYALASRKSVAD